MNRAKTLSRGRDASRKNRMFRGKKFGDVKNGRPLSESIYRRRDRKTNVYEETILVEVKTFYAHMIEFGHKWVVPDRAGKKHVLKKTYAPHPFMTPAYEQNRTKIKEVIAAEVSRQILKTAKGR